jgi:hypothetical protein
MCLHESKRSAPVVSKNCNEAFVRLIGEQIDDRFAAIRSGKQRTQTLADTTCAAQAATTLDSLVAPTRLKSRARSRKREAANDGGPHSRRPAPPRSKSRGRLRPPPPQAG